MIFRARTTQDCSRLERGRISAPLKYTLPHLGSGAKFGIRARINSNAQKSRLSKILKIVISKKVAERNYRTGPIKKT